MPDRPIQQGNNPTGYQTGTPQWDIAMILTRHRTTPLYQMPCARVASLRTSAATAQAADRLSDALKVPCDCGAGDADYERTSVR
jgi:hypothetical protein